MFLTTAGSVSVLDIIPLWTEFEELAVHRVSVRDAAVQMGTSQGDALHRDLAKSAALSHAPAFVGHTNLQVMAAPCSQGLHPSLASLDCT